MRIAVTAFSAMLALVWGSAVLVVAAANAIWPTYGRGFLDLLASVCPGFFPGPSFTSILIGTLYGLVDGAVAGAIVGALYNLPSGQH